MEIRKIAKEQESSYDQLNNEAGSVFTSLKWLRLSDHINVYGIFNKNNELIGGFSLFFQKRFGFRIARNPLFSPYIGPFFQIDPQNYTDQVKKRKEILSSCAGFINKLNVPVKSFSLSPAIIDTQPFIWENFKVIPNYTYIIELEQSEESLFQMMDSDKRNLIRKGFKDELVVKKSTDFQNVMKLVCSVFNRKNLRTHESILKKILFEFASEQNSFAFTCYKSDKPISSSFCIYDQKSAYYLLGGYDPENSHNAASVLTLWEAVKYAKALKLKYFDFEGSMVPSVERFFRGFGGTLTTYYNVNKAYYPLEVLLKIFRRDRF